MNTAAARTTSMLASAALLGALALAGLTMSISFIPPNVIDPTQPITMERLQPTPPVVHPPTSRPLPQPQTEPQDTTISTPPVTETQPQTETISTTWGPPAPPTVDNPHWLREPRNLTAYYPRRALDRQMHGQVQLDCLVTTQGLLQCRVIGETPSGWGFGDAALRISRDYRMVPAMRDGVPIEARYRMRVPFRVE